MAYMNQGGFRPSEIREIDFSSNIVALSDEEIAYVNGGLAPLAWAVAAGVRCAASTACRVAVVAAAGAVAAAVGYENNRV